MTDFVFVNEQSLHLQAKEVIREFVEGRYLLLRITMIGPYFPLRNSTPFVRLVGREGAAVESLMAEISPDQKELRGYFPTDVDILDASSSAMPAGFSAA